MPVHGAGERGLAYSVVVVTWQSATLLAALVDSMNRHLADVPELVVVDNDSADDPERAARRWKGTTEFVRLPENRGYGEANNLGVERARGEAIVLLNPDTELIDGSLPDLAAEAMHLRALVGPRLLNPDGTIQPSANGPPVGVWPWVNAVIPGALMPRFVQARTEPWRIDRRTHVSSLTGACVAAPREVLRELGPFDPAIHLYSEDLELGLRAARAGIRSYFSPEICRVVHHGGASAQVRFDDRGLSAQARSRRVVLKRTYGPAAERRSSNALALNLGLRVAGKRLLGRDAARDRRLRQALTDARGGARARAPQSPDRPAAATADPPRTGEE